MKVCVSFLLLVVMVAAVCVGGSASKGCPQGYTQLGSGVCVKVVSLVEEFDNRKTWLAAEELCEAEGASLVSLDDPGKLVELSAHIFASSGGLPAYSLWVGGRKGATGWSWNNGATLMETSHMWYPNDPKPEAASEFVQITPFSLHQRHYLMSLSGDHVAPGYVCEA